MISYVTSLKLTYSPLKIGHPKRKRSYSNHPFSGAMLVSGRVISRGWHSKPWQKLIYQLKGARSVAEMHQNSGQCESKCVRCQESCKFGGRVVVAVDLLIFFTWFMTYDIYSIMGGFAMFFWWEFGRGTCASTGRAHYVSVAPDPQNWTFLLMEEMLHQLRLKTSKHSEIRLQVLPCRISSIDSISLLFGNGNGWLRSGVDNTKEKKYTMFSVHFLRLHHPWDVIINLLFFNLGSY